MSDGKPIGCLKVAILLPTGHLFDTPCVPNLAWNLADNGVDVDVYSILNSETPSGSIDHSQVNVYYYPKTQRHAKEKVAILSIKYCFWVYPKLKRERYDFIIGCGIRGLFVIGVLSPLTGIPYAYNSLEIYSGDVYKSGLAYYFKMLERLFNRRADFSIIQDSARADILSRINRLGSQKVCVFPNAPYVTLGSQGRDVRSILESIGVGDTNRLVICSGSLSASWSGIPKILRVAPAFPRQFVLYLQSRSKDALGLGNLLQDLIQEKRVVFSQDPLSVDDYDALVRASDIGLAWYESDDENIHYVGLSSGKIAHYLRHGKPVIVNNLPLIDDIFRAFQCGVIVNDTSEISAALEEIEENYERYSSGARRAYSELFDMNYYAREIVNDIKDIVYP